jgi:hypothetical protein
VPTTETRFWSLLVALVAVLVIGPPMASAGYGLIGLTMSFSAVLLAGAFAVGERHWVRWASGGVVAVALLAEIFVVGAESRLALFVARALGMLYLGFATVVILARVIQEERVTGDTILGGCCVYLLVGVFFSSTFSMVELLAPGSFLSGGESLADVGEGIGRHPRLIYFSFVTLTTLGYGDVTPAQPTAEVLCALEAVIGQLFLAILIARLVGLHLHHGARGAAEWAVGPQESASGAAKRKR